MFIEYVRKYEKISLLTSILMLILSIFFIMKPLESVILVINLFGGIIFIDGVIHLISYIKTDKQYRAMSFEFMEGIIEILVGILVIKSSAYLSTIFPIMLGIWIVVKSILKIQIALNLQTIPESRWVQMLIMSVITAIFGLIVILNPFSSLITVATLAGILVAIYETLNISESIYTLIKMKKE